MLEKISSQDKMVQKICIIIIFLFIIFIFFWSRIHTIQEHFAHYDDLFFPYLFSVIDNYNPTYFRDQLAHYGGTIGSIIGDKTFDLFSERPITFFYFKRLLGPFVYSLITTSGAPIQFLMSAIVIDLNTSYSYTLITSRLPSAVFSALALLVFFYFSKNFEKGIRVNLLLIGFSILTFSWMFLIYSSQTYTYANGIFTASVLFLTFIKNYKSTLSLKQSFYLGTIISLLIFTNYQTMYFLPGFFLALYFCANFSLRNFLSNWFICGLISFISVCFVYLFIQSEMTRSTLKQGHNYSSGYEQQYFFNSNNMCDELGFLRCTFQFFGNNFFEVLPSLVSFSDLSGLTSKLYTASIVVLALFGFIYISIHKSKHLKGLAVFILVSLIVWIVLILFQLLSFGPTRHSLIWIVPISILASFGFSFIALIIPMKFRSYSTYLTLVFVFCFSIAYLQNFSKQNSSRTDPFQIVNIQSLIEDKNVSKIVSYGWTLNLVLFPEIRENFFINMDPNGVDLIFKRKKISDQIKNIMFISHRTNELAATPPIIKKTSLEGHNLIYSHETRSKTEVDFGDLTRNGSNNLIIQIFQPIKK